MDLRTLLATVVAIGNSGSASVTQAYRGELNLYRRKGDTTFGRLDESYNAQSGTRYINL